MERKNPVAVIAHIVFILLTVCFIAPLIFVILISISNEMDIYKYGYSIIPKHIDFTAYKIVFSDLSQMLKAFGISLLSAIGGSTLVVLLCASIGYSLSVRTFKYRKVIMTYVLITMLFGGGLIPTYIVNTQLLGLADNLLVHLVLGLVGAWNIILFRTFFSQIPGSVIESAVVDGATQGKVFTSIIIPMSKPIISTVFFTSALGRWNDWQTSLYYIRNKDLYSIQYLMQKVLTEAEFIRQTYLEQQGGIELLPVETMRYAMCVVGCLPIFILFPYMQKSFSKGLAVGSVKG